MVRGMRRQGEIHDQSCSHAEGQEVSGEHRFQLFGKTNAIEGFALDLAGRYERFNLKIFKKFDLNAHGVALGEREFVGFICSRLLKTDRLVCRCRVE
jgi:hypothetical protein